MRTMIIAILALLLGGSVLALSPAGAAAAPAATLPSSEAEGLIFMREEEKLARDVYHALAGYWPLQVFENIAASEQSHMDAVKLLLDRYGLADPAAGNAEGVFTNTELQLRYDQMVARGVASLTEALATGGAIEELDILDLQARLSASTTADITQAYTQLKLASENHLRAFVSHWEAQTGMAYQPQYLDSTTFEAIMNSGCPGRRGGGGGGRGPRP